MTSFYMIAVDASNAAPTKRYLDLDLAKTEAERLCHKEGRPAYILQAVAACKPPAAVWLDSLAPAPDAATVVSR